MLRAVLFLWLWISALLFLCVLGGKEEELLAEHNNARKNHGCGPLVLDRALCRECEKYAEEIGHKGIAYSEANGKYGENILITNDYKKAVQIFNAERVLYRAVKPEFSEDYRLFTQLIWKNTTTLGIGMLNNKENTRYLIVARYLPAGNIPGQFKENVPPYQYRLSAADSLHKAYRLLCSSFSSLIILSLGVKMYF
ncbi:Golgi-associated plant pathogenesis-related protein 1 [Drosophila mojavensis]|uniref:SCP domain-containing protein n=1 Tax=Drosophila mojavensis TaxID=7230 RepID=A0A0Q9XB84_DROMO|nr:Golgi-associated plant pathogenesis-related protein 1 [Drosophila mojavensis]KRG01838.1 uncharacterized protein Dmoj_GI26840 [Drosophila mojavensis]